MEGEKKIEKIGWIGKQEKLKDKISDYIYDGTLVLSGIFYKRGKKHEWMDWPPVKVRVTIEKI